MGRGRTTFLRRFVLSVIILAAIAALSSSLWLPWFGTYLVKAGPPVKSDLILVLAGDSSGNRILRAAELAQQGYAPKVLVSGPLGVYGHAESELAIAFAESHGYPGSLFISAPHTGMSTTEEAQKLLAEINRLGAHSILVVTSQTHTRRSARVFRSVAPGLTVNVTAAKNPDMMPETWWYTREGRKTIVFEWLKTIANWFGI